MATDPKDFGDRKPSDLDDVLPLSPTAGMSEIDYEVNPDRKKIRPEEERDFIPELGVDNVPEPPRIVYSGVVLGWFNPANVFPRKYWILRQDGQFGVAHTLQTLVYADIRKTDDVSIIESQDDNRWVIIANHRPNEAVWTYVYTSADRESKSAFVVPFAVKGFQSPIDNTFGDGQNRIQLVGEAVHVDTDDTAMHEIHWEVTLECTEPDDSGSSPIKVGEACKTDADIAGHQQLEDAAATAVQVDFNKYSGFHVTFDEAECTALVSLKSYVKWSALVSGDDEEELPQWTHCPIFGGNLGFARLGSGWLKCGTPSDYFWMTKSSSASALKVRWPEGTPVSGGAYLYAEGTAGDCVQLNWFPPGNDGNIDVLKEDTPTVITALRYTGGYCQALKQGGGYCPVPLMEEFTFEIPSFTTESYSFHNGLLIGGGDTEVHDPEADPPVCGDTLCSDNNPC